MNKRASGLLLHITSLHSKFGIGDLGPPSFEFVNFLSEGGQKYWQILPLNPTELAYGNSPYSCPSTYAGNPLLISFESMKVDGYLSSSDLRYKPTFPKNRVNYNKVSLYKMDLLKNTFEHNKRGISEDRDFNKFCMDNECWLADYCLYTMYRIKYNSRTWRDFPIELKYRDNKELVKLSEKEESTVLFYKFLQFIFFKQWSNLKTFANDRGIQFIGDLPYYVNYDSSDVWANQEIFKLDKNKNPEFIAGVPPDYFSETGQLWGNPVYDWDKLKESGYAWWIKRIRHNLSMFDKLRFDHFRGFVSFWEVEAGEKTALNGKWVHVDTYNFLKELFAHFEKSNFIAEDLGLITEDVREVIKRYHLPGMKILLFAFGDDFPHGDYLPHNIDANCVIYTGTHDNNTVIGWWKGEARDIEKCRVCEYIGRELNESLINWEFIKLALESRADIAIIPMQDILGLGEDSRMNTPATAYGNWEWKLSEEQLNLNLARRLEQLTEKSNRSGSASGKD